MNKMKKILLGLFSLVFIITSCENEDFSDAVYSVNPPDTVSAHFSITQDNTGTVTITPQANGAYKFDITPGNGKDVVKGVENGENVKQVYAEGSYTVGVKAYGINNLTAEAEVPLEVSFRAPENLDVTFTKDALTLTVEAEADYASAFTVDFGDGSDVKDLAIGAQLTHVYATSADYTVKVTALSGGSATTVYEETLTMSAPTLLPVGFEAFDTSTFISFGGNAHEIIDNPDKGGLNPSNKVVKIIKNKDQTWAGSVLQLTNPVDLSAKDQIKMKIWAPKVGAKVTMKLENISDGAINSGEFSVSTTKSKTWEELTWDFSGIDKTPEFRKVVIFYELGTMGAGGDDWTFYVDDFKQAVKPVVGFDPGSAIADFEVLPTLSGFDGGAQEIINNPDKNGNSSDKVLKLVKNAGQTWAGHKLTYTDVYDMSKEGKLRLKIWSPRAGLKLTAKFENDVPWPGVVGTAEVIGTTTKASEWEEMVLDFSDVAFAAGNNWTNLVLFIDNGTMGDGSSNFTVYLDDVMQSGTTHSVIADFEVLPTLSGFDGGAQEIINNPDKNGNSSDKVLKLVKNAGQTWAGHKLTYTDVYDMSKEGKLRLKIWSPRAGLKLTAKFENDVPWPGVVGTAEVIGTTTKASEWEEMVLDFSDVAFAAGNNWTNLVLFIDNGTMGDGSSNFTVYLDDIVQF